MSYFEGIETASVLLFYLKALALTGVLFGVRFLCIKLTKPKIDKNKAVILLSMIPKGLAAAVLISFYVSNVDMSIYASQELIFTTYGVILLSIFISSILVFIVEKRMKNDAEPIDKTLNEDSERLEDRVTDKEETYENF